MKVTPSFIFQETQTVTLAVFFNIRRH